MRKSSVARENGSPVVRATFEVPRPLYEAYKTKCAARDLTLSQALRKHMRDDLEQEAA